MKLHALERILILLTFVMVAYRYLKDEWPIGIEVEQ